MTYSKKYKKKSTQEKKEEISKLIENAEIGVSNVFESRENLIEYLQFMGQFYNYSSRNMSLIQSQFEGAQAVASFKTWKEKGYSVKKGEKGIKILVPYHRPEGFITNDNEWKALKEATTEEKEQIKLGILKTVREHVTFGTGTVFDVSQTTMPPEDYPSIFPNKPFIHGNFDQYDTFMKALYHVADKMKVAIVEPRHELGSARGGYYPFDHTISLNPRNNKLQNVSTLIHELGHAKMHTKDKYFNTNTPEKEFQAEMVNYVVCHHFGIDNDEGEKEKQSLHYIHNWTEGKTIRDKAKLLDEVEKTSRFLIENIEDAFEKEKEKDKHKHVALLNGDAILYSDNGAESVILKDTDVNHIINAEFIKCIRLKNNVNLWINDGQEKDSIHQINLPESLSKHSELTLYGDFLFTGSNELGSSIPLNAKQLSEIKKINHTVLKATKKRDSLSKKKSQELILER
ncbi:ArdC-like ssDNA-binding domain-containing protein [Heyndrickxia ginsengihumi]|uniref:ArdC-like ssDNA-binding domain-containing protein n=1 Tax=Heyndrickxia ginsengihumi TaxID=363870 RepID=UPI00046E6B23|nr:ArdC-like ssDNA-binding domain-containing protein [Heyndrickxia ginsengihumi]